MFSTLDFLSLLMIIVFMIPSIKYDADFIDLKYVDLFGKLRHISFPISYWKTAKEKGVGFDSSSLRGFKHTERSDLLLVPDETSSFIDPFFSAKTLSFFANIYYPYKLQHNSRTPAEHKHYAMRQRYEKDPRWILQKAVDLVKNEMKVDRILFLPELEFYVFAHFSAISGSNRIGGQLIDGEHLSEVKSKSAIGAIQEMVAIYSDERTSAITGSYHQSPPADIYAEDRNQLVRMLETCGVKVKYHHHEGGEFGQSEIEIIYNEPLPTADDIVIAKYIIKNYFSRLNKFATFMPKPLKNRHGSGLHFHHILEREEKSLFKGKNGSLSQLGENYIKGIFAHLPSLCAFCNPTTNSYKRLTGGFETPRAPTVGFADRTSAIRIPGYAEDFPIEYRVSDATCNPYLALAALLLAGLDGFRNKGNLKIARIPNSLKFAIDALKADSAYLTRDEVFPQEVIDFWIETKYEEFQEINLTPSPIEFVYYFDL